MAEPSKIEFRCDQCDRLLRVAEAHRGKWLTCPSCQSDMQVPDESEPPWIDPPADDPSDAVWDPRPVSVGEIFRDTWAIYVDRLWLLLFAWLVDLMIYAVGLVIVLIPAIAVAVTLGGAGRMGRELALLGILLVGVLGVITLSNLMACRHVRFFLKVARGEPVGISDALRLDLSPTTLLPIVFAIMVGIGLMILVIPGVYIYLTLWPYLWVWADQRTERQSVDSFPLAKELTRVNTGPSIAIGLVVLVGSFFGQAEIFTGTFARLLKAVAYLKMSGQPIADPHRRQLS